MGIEPTSSAWKAEVLPLNYTRRALPTLLFTDCNTCIANLRIATLKPMRLRLALGFLFPP